MNLSVSIIDKEVWKIVAKEMHEELFGTEEYKDWKDYDFAVLAENDKKEKVCFTLVKEVDAETAFLTFGGTPKKFRGQKLTDMCLKKISEKLMEKYVYIGFCCRYENNPMIKVGLDCGYKIIGMLSMYGLPHLEFLIKKGDLTWQQ